MNQFDLDMLPFRSFPEGWEPVIRRMLWNVMGKLTAAQRKFFRFVAIEEGAGGLRVRWHFAGEEGELPGVCLAIEPHIACAELAIEEMDFCSVEQHVGRVRLRLKATRHERQQLNFRAYTGSQSATP